MIKPRLQFRITTLLWVTACVAFFFGGRYWRQVAVPERPAIIPAGTISIKLTAGNTAIVNATVPVKRMMVADPAILSILPDSSHSFQLTAKQIGKTKVEICGDQTNPTITYDVTVQ